MPELRGAGSFAVMTFTGLGGRNTSPAFTLPLPDCTPVITPCARLPDSSRASALSKVQNKTKAASGFTSLGWSACRCSSAAVSAR